MKTLTISLFILSILGPSLARSAVWQVEKDGSGDFRVIQDAIDAAQDGDTIMIGPGRFSETHDFIDASGFVISVCGIINKSLNILGSGQGVTFLDPSSDNRNQNDAGGLAGRSSNLECTLSGFTFANCEGHALLYDMASGGHLEVFGVDVENCWSGFNVVGTSDSHIYDCNIQTNGWVGAYGIWNYGGTGFHVENCHLEGKGIRFTYSANSIITNCRVQSSVTGIGLQDCAVVEISNCQIVGSSFQGLWLQRGQNIHIHDVEVVESTSTALYINRVESLDVRDSVFQGGDATIYFRYSAPGFQCTNNHILPSTEGWTVWALDDYSGPDTWVDFTGNYWGTDIPGEVAASIHDGNDDPEVHWFINFEPMAGGPVANKNLTLDGVKALFR